MSDKQTIKERVDGIFKRNKTYYQNGSYNIEDIKQELNKAYKDHFIEMIDEEIEKLESERSFYIIPDSSILLLSNLKSKLMEGIK